MFRAPELSTSGDCHHLWSTSCLAQGTFPHTGPDDTDHARRVQVVELRRRPLLLARGNRDKPNLCAGFNLK